MAKDGIIVSNQPAQQQHRTLADLYVLCYRLHTMRNVFVGSPSFRDKLYEKEKS